MGYLTPKNRGLEALYPAKPFGEFSSVIGGGNSTAVTWAQLGVTVTDLAPSKYKVWLVNNGSTTMLVKQGGLTVFAVAAGSTLFEFMDPYAGDLSVTGTAADPFLIFATGQVKNAP